MTSQDMKLFVIMLLPLGLLSSIVWAPWWSPDKIEAHTRPATCSQVEQEYEAVGAAVALRVLNGIPLTSEERAKWKDVVARHEACGDQSRTID